MINLDLDNVTNPDVIGAYGLEAPGGCTCPVLTGPHTEDQCAAQLWANRHHQLRS